MKAVCLVSGGLDSCTCMAIAKHERKKIYALTILYGQRHVHEITAAKKVAAFFGAESHLLLKVELDKIGASSLTDKNLAIPTTPLFQSEGQEGMLSDASSDVPSTYVPARNLIFLSIAVAWAEALVAREVFIGANAVDFSGYPDCRPAFLDSFQNTAILGTKAGVQDANAITIRAPLLHLSKSEIISTGLRLGADFSLTSSCYQPDSLGRPCGQCHSCQIRLKGFKEAGIPDPLTAFYTTKP